MSSKSGSRSGSPAAVRAVAEARGGADGVRPVPQNEQKRPTSCALWPQPRQSVPLWRAGATTGAALATHRMLRPQSAQYFAPGCATHPQRRQVPSGELPRLSAAPPTGRG